MIIFHLWQNSFWLDKKKKSFILSFFLFFHTHHCWLSACGYNKVSILNVVIWAGEREGLTVAHFHPPNILNMQHCLLKFCSLSLWGSVRAASIKILSLSVIGLSCSSMFALYTCQNWIVMFWCSTVLYLKSSSQWTVNLGWTLKLNVGSTRGKMWTFSFQYWQTTCNLNFNMKLETKCF